MFNNSNPLRNMASGSKSLESVVNTKQGGWFPNWFLKHAW